jgi:nucleoside-triphosphatase THEP1
MAKGDDGKWRTVENRSLYNNIMLVGAHYHNELAGNLIELGYGIERTGKNGQFDISGKDGKELYSKEVIDAFSTRSAEIRAAMRDLGYDTGDPAMKQRATLITRAKKETPDREALKALWQEQSKTLGIEMGSMASEVQTPSAPSKQANKITGKETVEWATRHLEERNSVFSKNDLLNAALVREPGQIKMDAIEQGITELTGDGRLVEAHKGREEGYTTDRALEAERETIGRMVASKGLSGPIIRQETVSGHLEQTNLTKGQNEAVQAILGSYDRVIAVQGYAGSGKTTMLSTVREIAEERAKGWFGKETSFIGLAPSASATRTLENEAGINSTTLQSFLSKYSAIREDRAEAGMITKMQEEVKDSVIIVDEASMVSSTQMRDLLKITDQLEPSRVVLIGDIKQLDAVNAGQPFKQLQNAGMETALMDQIMRQRDENLKAAVIESLSGQPAAALARLDKDIIETDHSALAVTAATRWLMLSPETRENTGLMAPTHALREEINETIRAELTHDGTLRGNPVEITQLTSARLTEAEREVAGNYHADQVVLFENGSPSLDIKAGETLEVLGNKDGVVYIKDKEGREMSIDPSKGLAGSIDVYDTSDMELKEGDIIRWTRNDKEEGLINNHQAEITGIDDKGLVHFITEDGQSMILLSDATQFQHSDYAFNATVHAFQGRTVDNVIAVLDSNHQDLTNQKTLYVEISRARESATLITDDRQQLAITLEQNTGEQMTALGSISEEPSAGISIDERLEATIEEARVDAGLITQEEFEAISKNVPNTEYEGQDYDYDIEMHSIETVENQEINQEQDYER